MLKNYFMIAWRQLAKNKIYSLINILGLVVGLTVYLFGTMLVAYEENHDTFYAHSDRIFTAGTIFSATANIGVAETDGMYTALGPIILAEIDEIEEIARSVRQEFLLSVDDDHYYQEIRFVDPGLLKIFDFDFIEGDARALDDPSGVLLSKSSATKYFGSTSAIGKTMTLDHDVSLHVTAVIEDLPANTHFNSAVVSAMGAKIDVVAPLAALNRATGYDLQGNWDNLSMGDLTYMLLPADVSVEQLQAKIDGVFERHAPERALDFITGLRVRPLVEANTALWQATGMPVLDTIAILAFLVLVVSIANYTNLATAQSLGRSREIGLRKTMGAKRYQLIMQFLVESLCITTVSMLVALTLLEILVPVFNVAVGRALAIDYAQTLPWLIITTLAVGLLAGAYPSFLITRASPIDALGGAKGIKGSRFRSLMMALQFSISIFMLAMVMIVYLQNQKIENASNIYPKSSIITLHRVGIESIVQRHESLRNELLQRPDIESVSFSSQVPYLQNNSSFNVGPQQGDDTAGFLINQVFVDEFFLSTYGIELLAGRELSKAAAQDTHKDDVGAVNAIVNELALQRLGFASPADAINQVFYDFPDEREPKIYTIVGVMPDQNFLGFHNTIKPMVFMMRPQYGQYASIKVSGGATGFALSDIETVWEGVIPDYPIQTEYLEDTFNQIFQVFNAMAVFVGGFAFVALALSLVGLFGLSAFMAANRTKEIGIRKVMGASMRQIVALLVWQFSKPAMWALIIALPLAYASSGQYLNFFAERISMPIGVVASAGALAVLFAWCIVAVHAVKIARANPIKALRHE